MFQLPFIEHAQVRPIFESLNRDIGMGFLVPLIAHDGTGKTRLLKHWAVREARFDHDQVVFVNLASTSRKKGANKPIASSMTLVTFERTFFFLRLLKTLDWKLDDLLDREPERVYDDRRFLNLFDQVATQLKRQGIRAWIINDAHLLDTQALEYIVRAWKECDKQFGIVLAASLQIHEQPDEPLRDQLDGVPDARRYQAPCIELKSVEDEEFFTTVMGELFYALNADFSAEVERNADALATKAWDYTRGHWDAITVLATYFDYELGDTTRSHRLVTQDVVDRVFKRLLPGEGL